MSGNKEDRVSSRHNAANMNAKIKLKTNGRDENLTMLIPTYAPIVINTGICQRWIRHTRLSTIHMPIVRAAISGKIISFSFSISAVPTINSIINKA